LRYLSKCYRCRHPEEEHQHQDPKCKHKFTYKFQSRNGLEDREEGCTCPGFASSKEDADLQRGILRTVLKNDAVSCVFGRSHRALILDRMVCWLDLEITEEDTAEFLDSNVDEVRPILEDLVKEGALVNTLLGYKLDATSAQGKMLLELYKVASDKVIEDMGKVPFDDWFHSFYGDFILSANNAVKRQVRFEDPTYHIELLNDKGDVIHKAEVADVKIAKKLASILDIQYKFPE